MEIIIHIKEDGTHLTEITTSNGIESRRSRMVDLTDIGTAFMTNVTLETGLMADGIRYYSMNGNRENVVLEYHTTNPVRVRYNHRSGGPGGHVTYNIPIPRCLFFLRFSKDGNRKILSGSNVFCLINPLLGPTDTVYKFPFNNVNRGSGSICWGGGGGQTFRNLAGLDEIPATFWGLEFNGDLGGGRGEKFNPFTTTLADGTEGEIFTGVDLMAHLDGKPVFPNDILIPDGTFNDALRRVGFKR